MTEPAGPVVKFVRGEETADCNPEFVDVFLMLSQLPSVIVEVPVKCSPRLVIAIAGWWHRVTRQLDESTFPSEGLAEAVCDIPLQRNSNVGGFDYLEFCPTDNPLFTCTWRLHSTREFTLRAGFYCVPVEQVDFASVCHLAACLDVGIYLQIPPGVMTIMIAIIALSMTSDSNAVPQSADNLSDVKNRCPSLSNVFV